jgi:hypothetical protein
MRVGGLVTLWLAGLPLLSSCASASTTRDHGSTSSTPQTALRNRYEAIVETGDRQLSNLSFRLSADAANVHAVNADFARAEKVFDETATSIQAIQFPADMGSAVQAMVSGLRALGSTCAEGALASTPAQFHSIQVTVGNAEAAEFKAEHRVNRFLGISHIPSAPAG